MALMLGEYSDTGTKIDEDVYEVRFDHRTDIREDEFCKYEQRFDADCEKVKRKSFQLSFSVIGGDFDGTTIRKFFTPSTHENSKLRPFVRAMLGRELVPGELIDIDELIGKRFRATVFTNQRGYPDIKSPLPAKKRLAPVATPVVADEEDDESPF